MGSFLPYFHARLYAEIEKNQFRNYVADSLYHAPRGEALSKRYASIMTEIQRQMAPKQTPPQSGEEIAVSIIKELGLRPMRKEERE